MTRDEAIQKIADIIYAQDWRQNGKSYDYGYDGEVIEYNDYLDRILDVMPVAEKIVAMLESDHLKK